jgi:hypothetical protein
MPNIQDISMQEMQEQLKHYDVEWDKIYNKKISLLSKEEKKLLQGEVDIILKMIDEVEAEIDYIISKRAGKINNKTIYKMYRKLQKGLVKDKVQTPKTTHNNVNEARTPKTTHNKVDEAFYQKALEGVLGGTHKKLKYGITDITNDVLHAEIKEWRRCKYGIGQLICYNKEEPKQELHLYLFGKYGNRLHETVVYYCEDNNITPFALSYTDNTINVKNLISNKIVHSIPVN